MKRILDSGRVHVEITGEGGDKDKCESALKTMLQVSGQNRIASVEKELNLSAILYGPSVAGVDAVDDLIAAQEGNPWTQAHLKRLKKQTPFLIYPVRPDESYPMFGAWGMIGHVRKYKLRGSELIERWGMYADCDPNKTYEVKDFFYFHQRLVEAEGIKDPLLAVEWLSQDENGEFISSLAIPIFTRFAGGSGMYENPERQSQPLLYAKAKGGWHLRENLFWTYLFTGIYNQGLPGPVAIVKPDSADQTIQVSYQNGMKTIVMDGVLDNPPVIDGDVMRIHGMMEQVAATQTVQPQTLGMNSNGVTFSQFAMASKAGMIPAIDPKEAQEQLYTDIFRHILERIKAESIENELLAPGDIPDGFAITVKIEPDLEQDDLRNAQIALQIKQAGLASGEWIDTNLLKIPDSKKMWRQRKMEEMRDAIVELMKDPQFLSQYLPKKKAAPAQNNPGALPGAVPGAG
ncbi:MAG: hypothetical protein KC496_22825, partial [Anaerolineae bacterium]|nr:hypothetical protein [Anaerolineae bacterium]